MRQRLLTPGCKPTLLAMLIGASCLPVMAATPASSAAPRDAAQDASQSGQTMTVTASADDDFTPGGDQPVPAYLEGQVAHGGRLGMLGEQKAMDVPFNVIGFTAKMIEDQQAKTIADVVRNDAGVQNVKGYGNFAESYRIRGFLLDGDDMTYGGLPGVVPRQVMDASLVDRVEIFKGANSLLNGAASSGVGGIINLEPKHAGATPQVRVGVDYTSDAQIGTTVDAGRRFGDNDQFGVRVNLVHREGETGVDDEKKRTTAASIGLDYHGDRLRTSLDVGYQKKTFHDGLQGINISGVDFLPAVPSNSRNYSQKWVYSDMESEFGIARAEYDLSDRWTAYAGLGAQHAHETGNYGTPKLLNREGDATISTFNTNRVQDNMSGMAGLRGNFDTGFISHKVNVGYSALTTNAKNAYNMSLTSANTNIYHPDDVAAPPANFAGGNFSDPLTTARSRTQGYLLSDTLGLFDDSLLLTVGARHQKVWVRNYDYNSGAEDTASRYTNSRWMPTYGVVYKPWQSISLYANHTEALQPGAVAPRNGTVTNPGAITGIAHSKQNEVGVKGDFGRIGGTLSLFEIKKPSGMIGADGAYGMNGEQRHRGIETNLFGEPVLGFRLNASATWLDPVMTKTSGGTYDGKQAVGVPRDNYTLGAEYDIKPLDGLTATALITHTGSQWADAANSKKIDSYTTLDLGLRYRTRLNQNEMVWRVGVENVTNEKYWANVDDTGTYLSQGDGRTLKVGVTYDF
ncbi:MULTISPECIES: TonB-dependent receptor [Pantoea]|jgi:iron complex outermembrane receptor protein|uniref:TonB-dependent siderophore receptor n=1 Tax=Pantoea brenneri TaxID=472694 RepID=A0A7Y6TSH9_9GAMM|nr:MULTISPECIES: TonB-dependent siderophore receptor [Pantoea]KKD33681.1 TonB-dependent receptor [Pantoea sp. 3.5.1]MBZ6395439.1 TonB-dependent siderophore receptor [Pantoea sp.]MBZ6437187.1 TonB-dependent siderophore receptor [Pantoea sp.]NUY42238.1 TonB-dependent siderophore receptor [Pantoea brenneri]NUY49863.1 TonB-dependent siderophore receptor [Pantoea brenneri]